MDKSIKYLLMIAQNNTFNFENALFWDVNIEELTLEKDYFYIIKRVVLRGDKKDRIAMFSCFSKEKINEVLNTSREIPQELKELYLKAINER